MKNDEQLPPVNEPVAPIPAPGQPQSLTGKDVTDFGKDVGKDVVKQTIVWTLASGLTTLIRNLIKNRV